MALFRKKFRQLTSKDFQLLKSDPNHPSLRFRPAGPYWSVRVGLRYRTLAVEQNGTFIWFWIRTHADHDRQVRD